MVPVFVPPRETGFQATIEGFNGLWRAKVWARFQHASLEKRMTAIKQWLREHQEAREPMPDGMPRADIDAYDLANALFEPRQLLLRLYNAFQGKLKVTGASDADRSLLDAARDYLQRQGIVL